MSSPQPPAFSLYAFLNSRDYATQSYASHLDRILRQVKQSSQDRIDLRVAIDAQGNQGDVTYSQLRERGNDITFKPMLPLTFAESMRGFLEWAECGRMEAQIAEDVPRILLVSSHGIVGGGLSSKILRALFEKSSELNQRLDQIEKWFEDDSINLPTDDEAPLDNRDASDFIERLRDVLSDLEFEDFKTVSDEDLVRRVRLLLRLRQQPSLVETGVTLAAAGSDNDDRLSFKRLSGIIAGIDVSGQPLRFSIIVLHACSVGIAETVFELRNVADVVIARPLKVCGVNGGYEPAFRNIAGNSSAMGSRTDFAIDAANEIVAREEAAHLKKGTQSAMFAAKTDSEGWQVLLRNINEMSKHLRDLLYRSPQARTTLQGIRSEIRPPQKCGNVYSDGPCEHGIHDLMHLTRRLREVFGGPFASIESALQSSVKAIVFKQFASPGSCKDCRSSGMALYFPKTIVPASYSARDVNGFDFLAHCQWREFLDDFLP